MNLHGPRSKCVCRKVSGNKVSGNTKLPDNWMDFLRDSMNKKELLIPKVAQLSWLPANAVYVTSGQVVVSIGDSIPYKTVIMRRRTR